MVVQLTLFENDRQVSVRIVPQPFYSVDVFFGNMWVWSYASNVELRMADPLQSENLLKRSPYRVDTLYRDRVIEKVSVIHTRARGWLWLLRLREPTGADFTPYWEAIRRGEAPRCEECGSWENVSVVPSMTAYHFEPGQEDPNRPLTLCAECASEYVSSWTERWDEYRAGLL